MYKESSTYETNDKKGRDKIMSDEMKKEVLKKLEDGAIITLTNGRLAAFKKVNRTKFIGLLDGKRYNIPISMFHSTGDNREMAKKNREKQVTQKNEHYEKKKEIIDGLVFGDIVNLSDGTTARFLKKNKKTFLGKDKKTGELFSYPFSMALDAKKPDKSDTFLKEFKKKKALFDKYKSHSIQTVYGPSIVKKLSEDGELVTLYEFGTDRYDLSFDDFVSQIKKYN